MSAAEWIQKGHFALQQGDITAALQAYHQALQLDPNPELHYHLARLYHALLCPEEAESHFEAACTAEPERLIWQLQHRLRYDPLTFISAEHHQRLLQGTQAWKQRIPLEQNISDISRGGIEPFFDLNYLTLEDAPLRQAFHDVFIQPQIPKWPEPKGALRLGVIVSPGHEGLFDFGSRWLLFELAMAGIQVILGVFSASENWAKSFIRETHGRFSLCVLPPQLDQAARHMQQQECDLVYFWEAGSDPINAFLPHFQLGRTQLTSWGSVSSSGNSRMRYFLSAEALETPQSRRSYCESLVCLPCLPIIFRPEQCISSGQKRKDLGLPEGVLLGCPHNPQKFTPFFLEILQALLQSQPHTQIVMVAHRLPTWQNALQARIQQILGAQFHQIIWLPRLNPADFGALIRNLDFILDPFEFGAGKLVFESIGLGTPLLTLAGTHLRGRIGAAAYAQMGLNEWIAQSPTDYLQRAQKWSADPVARQILRDQLQANRYRLFHSPQLMPSLLSAVGQMAQYA